MAICNPRYPSNISNISDVEDFSDLLSGNPIRQFDGKELSTLNVLNNTLLNNSNLDNYPDLKERVEQGAITNEEFADFLLDKGLTLDYIRDSFINDFPVEIDYDSVKNIVRQTQEAIDNEIRNASAQNNTNVPYGASGDTGYDETNITSAASPFTSAGTSST